MRLFILALAVCVVACATAGTVHAKEGDWGFGLAAGSGYLTGSVEDKPGSTTFDRRYPAVLTADLDYEILDWFGLGLRNEMSMEEDAVYTMIPHVIFDSNGEIATVFGRLGPVVNFNPNYGGAAASLGLLLHAHRFVGFFIEASVETMFLGSDLTGSGGLVKLMGFGGLRLNI